MLKVDLALLERERRAPIDEVIPADAALWQDLGPALGGPVRLTGEAQQAGEDVVVRGRVQGVVADACRRCLRPVEEGFDDAVTWLFRAGVTAQEAEAEEVYVLPSRGTELDLSQAVRESVALAVPEYLVCDAACKGLCPHCGVNWNETTCDCREPAGDDRWAVLRRVRTE